jgi:hypothetical protein
VKSRLNSAWISGALDAETIDALANDLTFLPGNRNQRLAFLSKVNEEIDVYRKLTKPRIERAKRSAYRLTAFSEATYAFYDAFAALGREDFGAIEVELLMTLRRADKREEVVNTQVAAARSAMEAVKAAGGVARTMAAASESAAANVKRPTVKGRRDMSGSPIDNADRGLIKRIIRIYAGVFQERPSAAGEGIFAKTLVKIFKAAAIKTRPKQKRLAALIGESIGESVPAPKRGPKARTTA